MHVGTCLAQPLLWTCPSSNESDSEINYFPNIAFDETSFANSVQGSPYLEPIYVYRFQPVINGSCNNHIPRIEFCYDISEKDGKNNTGIRITILLGSIDDIESTTTFTGRVFIQETIETMVNCNLRKQINDSVCCQSVRVNVTLPTQLLQQVNAFGVEFPNQTLLEYADSQDNRSRVNTFVVNNLDFLDFGSIVDQHPVFMLRANGEFIDRNLRFLRFVIEESQSANNTVGELQLTIVIALPIVGGLTIIIFLSGIAVVIVAIWWRKRIKRKKMMLGKDPQNGFDNKNC